jgi:hypothetical protein
MKKILVLTFAVILANTTFAQRHEVGLFLGSSYYNGDLNTSAPFMLAQPAGGVAYRYLLNPRWAFKFNAYLGTLEGNDAMNPDAGLKSRNLYFKSTVLEFGGNMEFNFMKFVPGSDRDKFTPFIFAGLSVFRFNPKAEFGGQWYALQPLGTEGQGTTAYPDRKSYSLVSVGIPFGLGIKLSLSQSTVIGFEWGMRKTFTDYIDDVSKTYADPFILWSENTPAAMLFGNRSMENSATQLGLQISPKPGVGLEEDMTTYAGLMAPMTDEQRGDESNKDWYSFVGLTITFQIKGPRIKKCDAYKDHYYYKEYRMRR